MDILTIESLTFTYDKLNHKLKCDEYREQDMVEMTVKGEIFLIYLLTSATGLVGSQHAFDTISKFCI
jgi:hypothetical protein